MSFFLRNSLQKNGFLRVLLVIFLIFQMNALAIHEYNLRQSGHTLIHVFPWETGSQIFQSNFQLLPKSNDYFNIALCETHFLLNLLQQFQELFTIGITLAGILVQLTYISYQTSLFRYDHFLSSLSSRAPPVFFSCSFCSSGNPDCSQDK